MKLILASGSPRRKELMEDLGLEFQVIAADVTEDALPGEAPQDMVMRLSLEKASSVAENLKDGYVIGGDSMVVLDGQALGKPVNADDARRMLRRLSGTRHQVMTGISVLNAATGKRMTEFMASPIKLRILTEAEIDTSIMSGAPFDKAGAYAVQDQELRPAEWWQGCYPNIVGLPVCRLLEMLQEMGFTIKSRQLMKAPPGCRDECPFKLGNQSREMLP